MSRIGDYFRQSGTLLSIFSLILVALIGIIDYYTGYDLGLSIFYLMPIFIVTSRVGKFMGVIIALISALTWSFTNRLTGKTYSYIFIFYWNMVGRACIFVIFSVLVSKLRSSLNKEKILARKDFVTDVANSYAFYERAGSEVDRSRRYNRPLTVAYLDCDNFKYINDRYGHNKGNEVLRLIASSLHNNIRSVDMVARLGGDEFILLFPETGYDAAKSLLNRVQMHLSELMRNNNWPLTVSIGAATFTNHFYSVEETIKKADNTMYLAKTKGRGVIKHELFI